MKCEILHRFDYDHKSEWVKAADTLLTVPRFVFGGKVVDCYKLNRKKATFIESRPLENTLSIVILKVVAAAGSILGSPLFLIAFSLKYFNNQNQKIATRYCKKSRSDKFFPRPRLGNDMVSRIAIRFFMKYMGLDQLTASMQIQGDKILEAFTPGQYDGGLGLPIANILAEKLLPYTQEKTDFSTACFKATQALGSFQDLSKKMIPIMISRFFPIGWIFNREKYTQDLTNDLHDELKRLKRDHIIMIPLTFYSPARGYRTVVTSFTYKGDNKYDWKVYRSDVGQEGKMGISLLKPNRVPGVCLKGMTVNQVSDTDFLRQLIEFGTIKEYGQGEKFFDFVKKTQKEYRNVKFSTKIRSSRSQKADVYSIRSLNFALKDIMGKEHYNQYKLLSRIDNLIELNKAIESNAISNPEKLNDATQLFSMAKEDMLRRIDSFHKYFNAQDPESVLSEKQREILLH